MYPFLLCFGGPRLITCDSKSFYKPWEEVKAPFDHLIGVYGPGTIRWGVYGRELLREGFSLSLRLLIRLWLILEFIPRLLVCLNGILTLQNEFTPHDMEFTAQACSWAVNSCLLFKIHA